MIVGKYSINTNKSLKWFIDINGNRKWLINIDESWKWSIDINDNGKWLINVNESWKWFFKVNNGLEWFINMNGIGGMVYKHGWKQGMATLMRNVLCVITRIKVGNGLLTWMEMGNDLFICAHLPDNILTILPNP